MVRSHVKEVKMQIAETIKSNRAQQAFEKQKNFKEIFDMKKESIHKRNY